MLVKTLFDLLLKVGPTWILILLIFISVLCVSVAIMRFIGIFREEKSGRSLWNNHVDNWFVEGFKGHINFDELGVQYPCVTSRLMSYLTKFKDDDNKASLLIESFLSKERLKLEKYINILGTVGNNAPFIGLLGTVLGIIASFNDISTSMGNATIGIHSISGGISEALVATAVGLLVAIPAVMAFNYFRLKIDTIISRAESLGNFLISERKQVEKIIEV